jgi:antibiotic biosynthesis monooxygenase (ABM) superfamily enzyme
MSQVTPPKKWKFALLVWCFIYPAITILSITLIPLLDGLPGPMRSLIVSLILVPVMAFFYIPFINKRFFNWLRK